MYCVGFSHKRGDRGFQTGQICRVMCRWILPALATTTSHYPQHNTRASPWLPGPASGILEKEVAGQSLGEAVRCKRDGKTWFCAKFVCCCKRSAQEKYREFVAVSVRISLEKLDWNLWKLKWEKWVWPDALTWAQRDCSGLFCWSTAEDMETWHCETVVHIDNFQGIFMDNRINGHANISRGQLVHKSACWLHFSHTTPERLPSSGRLAQG